MLSYLTPQNGFLFRVTHAANLPWIVANGLHSASATRLDPSFIPIGNADLIAKRTARSVPVAPGGTLADYVPFYFTPKSPMLLNIHTGRNGVVQRSSEDIVVLVTSFAWLARHAVQVVYTDRHAFKQLAEWRIGSDQLAKTIDWDILRRHDFAFDQNRPDKMDRYMAEALAYGYVPFDAIGRVACVSDIVRRTLLTSLQGRIADDRVATRPTWFFQ